MASDLVRAFYALSLDEPALVALSDAQERMKRRALRSRLTPRWTSPAQLHLTLKFLGWVTTERVDALSALVAKHAAACAPIEVAFSGVIGFGSPRRARIVAAGLDDRDGRIAELFRGLEADLETLGFAREERTFRAHVTLARIKRPGDVRDWLKAAELAPVRIELRELVLYRSILGPDGSTYTRLAAAPLGPNEPGQA